MENYVDLLLDKEMFPNHARNVLAMELTHNGNVKDLEICEKIIV